MMEYKGFGRSVNGKPQSDEWIEVFASDWNKDYWSFYAYIGLKTFEQDINKINDLIQKKNWRDGDVYVELINHSPGLEKFYHILYEEGRYTHHNALDPERWRKWLKERA